MHAHSSYVGELGKSSAISLKDQKQYDPNELVRRVYLVTDRKGAAIFLDKDSANSWGDSNCKEIKEVSLETAAFVVKADKSSATALPKETREAMRVVFGIISLANELASILSSIGLSTEDLVIENNKSGMSSKEFI